MAKKKIERMTKMGLEEAKCIRAEVNSVLNAHFESWGLSVNYAAGTYYEDKGLLKARLEITLRAADGTVRDLEAEQARKDYALYASGLGLKVEWLDRIFEKNGETLQIVGLNPGRKKPIILKSGDKTYSAAPGYVQLALADDPEKVSAALKTKAMDDWKQKLYSDYSDRTWGELSLPEGWAIDPWVDRVRQTNPKVKPQIVKTFEYQGHTYKVLGFEARRKYKAMPIAVEDETGKMRLFGVEQFKQLAANVDATAAKAAVA